MSSPASQDHSRAAAWLQGHWRTWRAGFGETLADDERRRRLIRVTAIWTIIALAVAVFFALFDWDWFRGPLARVLSARTGRPVQIQGHLEVHPFSRTPSATVGGVVIGNPKWMGGGQTANLGRTTVKVDLLPLLKGRVTLPLVDVEQPKAQLYSDASGRNNWTFGNNSKAHAKLPLIQHFILRDGALHIDDKQRKLTFDGTVSTSEDVGRSAAAAFHLDGQGRLNGAPFTAHVTGGPLVHVQRDRPYPFDMEIRSAYTHVLAKGQVTRPFDFGKLQAAVQVSGHDLADLYHLTGVVLPNTPAYSLSGEFARDGETYRFPRFAGRVGRSDLHGSLSVQKVKDRRFLKADIASRTLDVTDLGALFGGAQAGKAPAVERAAVIQQKAATGGRLLPDAPLDVQRVRVMDADVRYRADSVKAPHLPLRRVGLHLTLDHGLLRLDPVSFTMPHGQVIGRARIDARGAAPVSGVDFAVTDVRLEDLMPKVQGRAPMEGVVEARAKLTGQGNSVHRVAAASNGRIAFAIPAGKMRQSLAELMGVNVVPGLFQLLSKDPKETGLRCAVADFDVRNGVMTARSLVLDTDVVVTDGSGAVNLGTEKVDLTLKGHSKKIRLMRVIAPLHVRGQLGKPALKVDTGPAVAQAGVAVGLGALLSPLAAIVPFISPGGAKDANCAALLAQVRSAGAPVRGYHIAQAAAPKPKGR